MLISKEGQVLMNYLINTGQQASFTVPLGSKVLDKAGKALSTVSISMLAEADVPAVPGGTTYTFAGFAVKCSPDGATFSPAASLKFTLTTKEWDAVLAKANGNSAYLSVKFYDAASASWVSVPTTVDPSGHSVTGSVSHYSTYGLFADTTAATPVVIETPQPTGVPATQAPTRVITAAPVQTTPTPAPGGIPWMFIIGVVVVIVVVGGGAYYYLSKGKK